MCKDFITTLRTEGCQPYRAVPPGVVLIRAEKNDMMNRYTLPHKASRVDALLTVDDDVLLTEVFGGGGGGGGGGDLNSVGGAAFRRE